MQNLQLDVPALADLPEASRQIIHFAQGYDVWLFTGEMGTGKTTLIRHIGQSLGVEDNICSPSFSIVNEYADPEGTLLYHFDFYRIKDESEAWDIGVEEYFDSGNRCFVEWPEKIPNLWPERYVKVQIHMSGNGHRTIHISRHGK